MGAPPYSQVCEIRSMEETMAPVRRSSTMRPSSGVKVGCRPSRRSRVQTARGAKGAAASWKRIWSALKAAERLGVGRGGAAEDQAVAEVAEHDAIE